MVLIAIRGINSNIAVALCKLLPNEEKAAVPRGHDMPLNVERYLFTQGLLRAKRWEDQSQEERAESQYVNCDFITHQCERLLAQHDRARICVIGSESAYAGSYDGSYSASKRALHSYVEGAALRTPFQQLVCVAPTVIGDAGMTLARHDKERLTDRMALHPKKRWLTSMEVARVVKFLLYDASDYLTGVVIRMNGGTR